ncbi:MFS transporter permease [Yersinia sp. Marseille-Q3913]|uniref:MFS transporter permease n=1 Tax=Yersinia sp. Marseille-Q3913 TaxID=2830769 RepID=UPI0020135C81|nr:MFS transporter permease [Yersinia sp. Marseille-Q3913]
MKSTGNNTIGNSGVGSGCYNSYEYHDVNLDNDGDLFNEVYAKLDKALSDAGYIGSKGDYPHLRGKKNSSKTIDEVIFNLNNHLRENNTSKECKKLVELINSEEGLGIKDNYDFKAFCDHFYLKNSGVTACLGNPFAEQPEEVSNLVKLYNDIMSKEYKGSKDIKLRDGLGTMEDFCCEVNRVYDLIKKPTFSTLKKAFNKFSKDNHVKRFINKRENDEVFYQLVKKKTDSVEEPQDSFAPGDNIKYSQSIVPTPVLPQAAVASMQVTPPNLFYENAPPELVELKAIYCALVEAPYKRQHDKTTKTFKLENEKIGTIDEFCRALNEIKNSTSGTDSSSRYQLLVNFVKDKEVAKSIGIMEGAPKDFYIKPTKGLCNNGLLLQGMLNEYINAKTPALQTGHVEKITEDLKNKTLRDNILIELKPNGPVNVINFPDNNEKIALVLSRLLESHQADGTFSKKIAEYLKVSGLGAYMQLQPLPGNKSHVVFNHDTPDSVNDKINDLTDLMDFMRKHLKHINTVLGDLGTRPVNASLEQLQVYYYQQMLAFDIRSSTYTEPPGSLMFAQRWIQANWDKLFGNASTQTHFGVAGESPIVTIKKLRQSFNTNLQTQNYEKSARKSPEYKIVDQGLDRIEKLAQRLEDLITKNTIPADITKNLTLALRYAMASECVELKQQSKSINFNRFFSKAKLVVPVVAALSIGVLIAGSSSVVLAPLAPFIAIGICCAAVYYLFTKCKPKLESSGVSEQLTKAMKGLVPQGDFHLASHDVSWREAWKYRMGPIIQAFKTWWSGSVAPMPNLPEPPNPSLH